jgi:formylglycine-generating enzyme required for sulfatase activity
MTLSIEAVITSPSLVREQWLPTELAVQEVVAFERRFGTKHLKLACHAALPLILTPALINLIRINFLEKEQIPWEAEVDFLLSPLCRPLDEGLYEVEPSIREVLLVELENQFSWERPLELAEFLQFYLQNKSDLQHREEITRTQQWIAQAYIDPDKVIEELTALQESSLSTPGNLQSIPKQIELVTTLEILAEPLETTNLRQKYHYLVSDSRVLAQFLYKEDEELKQSDISQKQAQALLSPVLVSWLSQETTFVEEPQFPPPLQTFEFDVATVEVKQSGRFLRRETVNITRRPDQAQYFTETLPDGVTLEMVSIPGGTFLMGAPETEEDSRDNERPQHKVTVPRFFMGKYPVTQKQWRAVASLERVNRELNPNPSRFKGDDLPVEKISWYDCVEFCARLSAYTKRDYRLPSEAEWEYACRARTTTPFHFGETISTEVANYNGKYIYGSGSRGEYRERTTPVGSFHVANAFGLFDMHGNVWEWCADEYHQNYQGTPVDGSAWVRKQNENDNQGRMLRGGSWIDFSRNCRSASRDDNSPDSRNDDRGFRVVVSG